MSKITVDRKVLSTLVRDRKELQALYSAGVMDWDGFEEIDWDSI